MNWLSADLLRQLHAEQLVEHGGPSGEIPGRLEAVIGRPQAQYAFTTPTPDLADIAAAYSAAIARGHPFADGNKRTAFLACGTFLEHNGWGFDAPEGETKAWIEALAEGDVEQDEFAEWLRDRAFELDDD